MAAGKHTVALLMLLCGLAMLYTVTAGAVPTSPTSTTPTSPYNSYPYPPPCTTPPGTYCKGKTPGFYPDTANGCKTYYECSTGYSGCNYCYNGNKFAAGPGYQGRCKPASSVTC